MRKGFFRLIPTAAGLLLLAGFVASSVRSASEQTGPDDATCLGCHDGYDKTLANTVHRLSEGTKGAAVKIACVSCHEGGSVHADDPSKSNITNPASLSGDKAQNACASCHLPHQELDDYGFNAHSQQQLNCSSCHKVHAAAPVVGLLIDDNTDFCGKCHNSTKLGFLRRSNHPVLQGAMTCLSCHRFTKRADQNQAYGFGRVCEDCHSDVAGPYRFEHPVANAYDVQGSGCIECHNPHGSENDKLLRQPNNTICQSCHAVPRHNTAHDGAYANLDCLACHTDIHGSAVDYRFLDQNLSAKFGSSCYCHSLN